MHTIHSALCITCSKSVDIALDLCISRNEKPENPLKQITSLKKSVDNPIGFFSSDPYFCGKCLYLLK